MMCPVCQRPLCDSAGRLTACAVGERPALRAATLEPSPIVRQDVPAIQDLVIADIEARKAVGIRKYGTVLQAHNGRDALMDAYQEALDLAMYLRQAIEERTCDAPAARP